VQSRGSKAGQRYTPIRRSWRLTAERTRQRHTDPEFKAKHAAAASENLKRLHADSEFAAAHALTHAAA
jgi:hypothetical protein